MKNITVSIEDETYRQARVRAAELDMSVSALVRQFLQGLAAAPVETGHVQGLGEGAREFGRSRKAASRSRSAPAGDADIRSQLQLMEELWTSLSAEGAQFESPRWHGKAIEETVARYEAGDEKPVDWAAAKRKLRKRAE